MITVFKISHLNSAILDDETLKNEIESCRKQFNDIYTPLKIWTNKNERNLIFYKRYYNSLAFEHYYRFKVRIEDRFPPIQNSKKFIKLPEEYWFNGKGIIERGTFKEISKKYQEYLKNKWETSSNLKWTNRWNNYKEVLEFMKGAEDDC